MKAIRFFPLVSTIALMSGMAACSASSAPEEDVDGDEAAEVWNSANNPAFVDSTFSLDVATLPLEGTVSGSLIPGDYWATARDSVNARWDGETSMSPAEKLEKALNKPGLARKLSENFGIRAQTNRKECTKSEECSDLKDGSSCSFPRGDNGQPETKGRCIPSWWGICHGWAPYAFSEPAPVKEVKVGDVPFYPGDLEGLMSLAYSKNLPTKFISQRCNKKIAEPGGRVEDSECRDMNPASMHVVIANMLGIRHQSLVEDRTFDDEVWNQPVRSYKVTNGVDGKLKEITKAEAIALLGEDVAYKELLARTAIKKGETKAGVYAATADGEIVVRTTGNGDADLYVNVNAEATSSANVCSSTGGSSEETCKVNVKAGDKVNYLVLGYAETSEAKLEVGTQAAATTYKYNPNAVKFYHVKADLTYITESRPDHHSFSTRLDDYSRKDELEYILEVDAGGRAMGGEWLNASRRHHPDFMWWPTAKPQGSIVPGVTYADIKKIHDLAAEQGGGGTGGADEIKDLLKDATISRYSSTYAIVGLKGGQKLKVEMDGTGNADLMIRVGSKPTVYKADCKSEGPTSKETCEVTAPGAGGTYHVRVRPMGSAPMKVTVKATISTPR